MREVKTANGSFWVHAADISDWTKICHECNRQEGDLYTIYDVADLSRPIGRLQYLRNFPQPGTLSILKLGVSRDYQRRGVASNLLIQLHVDNPDWYIDPGVITESGREFARYVLEEEPHPPSHLMPGYVEKTVGY